MIDFFDLFQARVDTRYTYLRYLNQLLSVDRFHLLLHIRLYKTAHHYWPTQYISHDDGNKKLIDLQI
jgi:hypothetical protein